MRLGMNKNPCVHFNKKRKLTTASFLMKIFAEIVHLCQPILKLNRQLFVVITLIRHQAYQKRSPRNERIYLSVLTKMQKFSKIPPYWRQLVSSWKFSRNLSIFVNISYEILMTVCAGKQIFWLNFCYVLLFSPVIYAKMNNFISSPLRHLKLVIAPIHVRFRLY